MSLTDAAGAPSVGPAQPPAPARSIAMDLVKRYGLRLADQRDSRLGSLAGRYDLALAAWTGSRGVLVAFYTPPGDPVAASADVEARYPEAIAWGEERLNVQRAQTSAVLLVALGEVGKPDFKRPPSGRVSVGIVAIDAASGKAEALLPVPPGLPSVGELRRDLRVLRSGGEAPTLAAIDLAARDVLETGHQQRAAPALAKTPVITYSLIGVFIAVFALEKALISSRSGIGLIDLGALVNAGGTRVDPSVGAWWRFVSSAFLHDDQSLAHVGLNSFALWNIGRFVEIWYGRLVFLGTFLLTAVAGGVTWIVLTSGDTALAITVGASGGICGLMGLLMLVGRFQGREFPRASAAGVRQWIAINAALVLFAGISGLGGGVVNNYAHVGGFVAGMGLALVLPPRPAIGGRDLRKVETGALALVVAVAVVALGFAGVQVQSKVGTTTAIAVDARYLPTVTVGKETHFEFDITNVGTSRISNLTILFDDGDRFLDHYTVVSAGSCTVDSSLPGLACGPLAPGAEVLFTLRAQPRDAGRYTFKFHVGDGLTYLPEASGGVYVYSWSQSIEPA